jgi:Uma2 family endonuclease
MNSSSQIPAVTASLAAHKRIQVPIVSVVQRRTKGRMMSLASYMNWKPEDGFKYEWNNGILEQRIYTMTAAETNILVHLNDALLKTKYGVEGGRFLGEVRIYTSPSQVRIPDIIYLTEQQRHDAQHQGIQPLPAMVMEIISENDTANRIDAKVREYFASGVQTVWHIKPRSKIVESYTSPKHITVYSDSDVCSAAPALPDLRITANELFA